MAHKPFEKMFTGTLELQTHSIIGPDDVVFFDGGNDVDPSFYGEEPHIMTAPPDKVRDNFERWAFQQAQKAGASCVGVCRGAQFLCVLSGGKLVQHVTGHNGGHMIYTDSGRALLSESSHHQVMWPYEIPHVLIATANKHSQEPFEVSDEYGKDFPDGEFPEIIYCKDTRSLCIQGHAEFMSEDSVFRNFARQLVREFILEGSK
jgi:GMP synthase-like glutamine amidotransferase